MPRKPKMNHQVFRSAQPVSSSFCDSFIYQTVINFLLFSVIQYNTGLPSGSSVFWGEEMSTEMLDPGSGGSFSYLEGEGDTEFHRGGGPRSPHGTVPALLGTRPLGQDLGVQVPGTENS